MTLTGMAQDSFMLSIACGLKIGSVRAQYSNCGHRSLDYAFCINTQTGHFDIKG